MITPEDHDSLGEVGRFRSAVLEGLRDLEAGRTISDEELDADLDAILGPA